MEIKDIKESFYLFREIKKVINNDNKIPPTKKDLDLLLDVAACKCLDEKKPLQLEAGSIEKAIRFLINLDNKCKNLTWLIYISTNIGILEGFNVNIFINQNIKDIEPAGEFKKFFEDYERNAYERQIVPERTYRLSNNIKFFLCDLHEQYGQKEEYKLLIDYIKNVDSMVESIIKDNFADAELGFENIKKGTVDLISKFEEAHKSTILPSKAQISKLKDSQEVATKELMIELDRQKDEANHKKQFIDVLIPDFLLKIAEEKMHAGDNKAAEGLISGAKKLLENEEVVEKLRKLREMESYSLGREEKIKISLIQRLPVQIEVVDEADKPVSGIIVSVKETTSLIDVNGSPSVTDNLGIAKFNISRNQQYAVSLRSLTGGFIDQKNIPLNSSENTKRIQLFKRAGTVEITVSEQATGKSFAGVPVSLTIKGTSQTIDFVTDNSGRTNRKLPIGDYIIRLKTSNPPLYDPIEKQVTIIENKTSQMTLDFRFNYQPKPEFLNSISKINEKLNTGFKEVSTYDTCIPLFFKKVGEKPTRLVDKMIKRPAEFLGAKTSPDEIIKYTLSTGEFLADEISRIMREKSSVDFYFSIQNLQAVDDLVLSDYSSEKFNELVHDISNYHKNHFREIGNKLFKIDTEITQLSGKLTIQPVADLWRIAQKLQENSNNESDAKKRGVMLFMNDKLLDHVREMYCIEEVKARLKFRKENEIPLTYTNSIGMKFMLIPTGEFMMGSEESEKPVHRVKISKPFYLGIYPVTQREWIEVMGSNPSYVKGDDLPVEQVSWDDVQEFIKKLNEKEGTNKYRLPSEAEWEYAARAGTTTRYSFGDDESKLGYYAWYEANSGMYLFSWDEIPGNENERLIDYLKQNFGIDWVKTAKIERIDDGHTIIVFTEKNSLSLRLSGGKSMVCLEIDDGMTSAFDAYMENGKLCIYSSGVTHEVGQKKPNPLGLYDMHGNVLEWVQDSWHNKYNGAPNDGSAWESGSDSERVIRGGSWLSHAFGCRSAFRAVQDPVYRDRTTGFRLLRIL